MLLADCERNVSKRLLQSLRREHSRLIVIVVEDSLAFLFDWIGKTSTTATAIITDDKGIRHRFRHLNKAPLNDTHFDLEFNFLEYWEIKPAGKTQHFSWVTDLPLRADNLMAMMRGARARWKIENETFNTLKNQGDLFEHNFGHRPDPAALLPAVPGGAAEGRAKKRFPGESARHVPALPTPRLGNAVRWHCLWAETHRAHRPRVGSLPQP